VNPRSLRFRMTAWYAGLLASTLLIVGGSVYVGLQRYLDWTLKKSLATDCQTIGTELLWQIPKQPAGWLAGDINEDYAPEINGRFLRITQDGVGTIYLSGAPKSGAFDPARVPLPQEKDKNRMRKVRLAGERTLLIDAMIFTTPDGSRFVVESGTTYDQVEVVLHGLLLIFAVYVPFVISLAVGGGYWLMRRSLRPIDEITRRAEGITSSNLSERLPVIETGDELERLSTALNRMIARLEDAFEHIHRFSADASHELRTPLTVLQLELEGMIENHRANPALTDQMGSALEEAQRMSRIVENLLTISRMDAGEVKMEKAPLDLGELAIATADAMKLIAEEKSIELRTRAAANVGIEGDRTRVQQVIVNLIDNAIKYTQEGGWVEVSVRREGALAVLQVSDNGAGISADALPHVFERFYRADKARSRTLGGAGLGLSIVKAICAAHGAEIKVTSEEGCSSSFRVEMAAIDVPQADEVKAPIPKVQI
jgi:heavy metal sensor kinase